MPCLRSFLAVVLSISLAAFTVPPGCAAHPPVGILTLANHAHLDEAAAFPGLSVFEGERLSTEAEGRLDIRVGHSTLALAENTEITLYAITGGMHVDMSAGSLYFSGAENETIEVHAAEALLRPDSNQPAQAMITVLAPKVLQVTARRGGLNFTYRQESQNLPQGETYRIYLDASPEAHIAGGIGSQKKGGAGKVAYFIVGAGAGGLTAWRFHGRGAPRKCPISPAKP